MCVEKEDCEIVSQRALVRDAGAPGVSQHYPQVEAALKESGVREGLALVNAMHITASVFINDDERGLHADYDEWLERLAPHEPVSGYRPPAP